MGCRRVIYFFSSVGFGFTLCQGSLRGFGVVAHDDPFVARSYCSSICLASRRCCAFGSSWECAEEIANKPIIIAGTAIFLIVTLPKATRKAGLGVPPTPGLGSL